MLDLVELLTTRAKEHPTHGYSFYTDGVAEPEWMSYPELDRRARAIAAQLIAKNATGEAVLILCPPGLDYIAAFFGCLYAGAIATPAYPPDPMRLRRTLPRLRAIVADTRSRIVLSTTPIITLAPMVAEEAPELSVLDWIAADVETGLEASWTKPTSIAGESIAFLQYTSGSTSKPKGVMVTHANLLHNSEMIRVAFEFDVNSRLAFWLPPYHDMGLIGGIISPLFAGGTTALMSPFDFLKRPMSWLEMIAKSRSDVTGAPNFAFDLAVRKSTPEQRAALDLSCLTLAFNAAEPIRAETMDAFADTFAVSGFERRSLYACFGLAETTLLATGTRRHTEPRQLRVDGDALERGRVVFSDRDGARRLVSLGTAPIAGSVAIVDPQSLRALGEGEVGEIWLKSDSVARGYWDNAEATAQSFGAVTASGEGPYLRTGDLGFVDGGELFFVSRIKDIIILRGRNHYPHDIERAVEGAHPALRPGCGVVFGVDRDGEEKLGITWEVEASKMRAGSDEVIAAIKRAAADKEGVFADTVVLIEAKTLPKTSSGKLQRKQTKQEYEAGELSLVAEWRAPKIVARPSNDSADLRDFLIERLAAGLGLHEDAIDPDLPFQEYGFDSAMVVALAADLSARTGREFPATLAFNYPTINALTAHLAQG